MSGTARQILIRAIPEAAIAFITRWEGLRLEPYNRIAIASGSGPSASAT